MQQIQWILASDIDYTLTGNSDALKRLAKHVKARCEFYIKFKRRDDQDHVPFYCDLYCSLRNIRPILLRTYVISIAPMK